MVHTPRKPDDRFAPKLRSTSPNPLGRLLIDIGRPFYFLLSYAILAFLFVAYWTGRSARLSAAHVFKLATKLSQIKLPKVKIPKVKIPKVKTIFALLRLRLRLKLIKLAKIKLPFPKVSLPRLKPTPVIIAILVLLFLTVFWAAILKDLPKPSELVTREIEVSTKIYDRNGVLLYKIYKEKNRTPVTLGQIPSHVRLATLAIEDAEFYTHPGFSIRGIVRAMIRNATRGELTGGSTITQQLVKNALLSSEKTLIRKLREITLAVRVEIAFTKDEILEMYFNEVSYGGTAYGIQEAARVYFVKDVDKLSLAEAALLAGLPRSPTKFSPFGPNPDLAKMRQKEVLKLMVVNRYIDKEEAEKAKKEKLKLAPNRIDIKAPHFVMYVRQALVEKYGEEVVEKGGLEVTTTLDYSIQKMAEEVVKTEIDKLARLKVGNGAGLVINPKTGEILAMIGSKDYFDTKADGNVNVTTRPRQPGSAIKIVNYSYALSNGYTPATILSDTPVTFAVAGQPPYSPRNYDGAFRGKLTLRSALAESRNVPAVKVLASYGVSKMIEQGKRMGITTWNTPGRFGLSLTLGGADVKLIDLAQAYATIANYGKKPEFTSILKVANYKGKVLEENECPLDSCVGELVVDPRVAYLLIDILKDNVARAPAFGSYSQLVIPGHPEVAVKTGTSNNLRDNLTIGFNQDFLVAIWVGNNDNSSMSRVASGITGATPIFNKIMRALLAQKPNDDWPVPSGLVQAPVCTLTGTLPCGGCPTKVEWFLEENKPSQACNPELIKQIKEKGNLRRDFSLPGQILEPAASTER